MVRKAQPDGRRSHAEKIARTFLKLNTADV